MKEFKREYPLFSLCGLNCGLCPHYQSDSISKCPGCGGEDFNLKHPSCSVITCNKKHNNAEYCCNCSYFPCEKYKASSNSDSFISYHNVISDFTKVKKDGIDKYKSELNEKVEILEYLIKNYNDGRRKNFYCIAVNLINLIELRIIMNEINIKISKQNISLSEKIRFVISLFETYAKNNNIDLILRKNQKI